MSDTSSRPDSPVPQASTASTTPTDKTCARPSADAMLCDRCNAEMFRMHAVWRCPACGYKTDCCGW